MFPRPPTPLDCSRHCCCSDKRLPETVGCIAIPLRHTYGLGVCGRVQATDSTPHASHASSHSHTHDRPASLSHASHHVALSSARGIHAADQQAAGRRRRIRWGGYSYSMSYPNPTSLPLVGLFRLRAVGGSVQALPLLCGSGSACMSRRPEAQ